MSKIDDTTTLYCKAFVASQQTQQSQTGPIPMGFFRSYVAAGLAKRALGEQLAAAYDVQPASGYQQQVSQLEQALTSAPADQQAAVIDVAAADAYLQNVQVAIGQELTGKVGQTNAEIKAALQRGQVATRDWLADHKVYLDPVFGRSVDGGSFSTVDNQTSYPLSPLASQGAQLDGQQAPPSSYTAQLPSAQVCG
jgi:peptidyl-prolyl cis-trans isomerase SurA